MNKYYLKKQILLVYFAFPNKRNKNYKTICKIFNLSIFCLRFNSVLFTVFISPFDIDFDSNDIFKNDIHVNRSVLILFNSSLLTGSIFMVRLHEFQSADSKNYLIFFASTIFSYIFKI